MAVMKVRVRLLFISMIFTVLNFKFIALKAAKRGGLYVLRKSFKSPEVADAGFAEKRCRPYEKKT